MIKARCENADKGCTDIIDYLNLKRHQAECGFATVRCTNYGCEQEMFQKEFSSHDKTCEYRIIRCDKCDVIKEKDVEHDCTKSMAAKYEHLEGKLIAVSQKLEL